jgi:hypothetical protein
MTHALKTWPQYFKDIMEGGKNFELRKDDRPFKVGDTLILQEYHVGGAAGYSGEEISRVITYILRDAPGFGLKEGYCIIGFKEPNY